jgi:solute carrier family 45 protein 1/2/4
MTCTLPLIVVWAFLTDAETDCTPYLLQLGLSKSRTSLVWIAGPLSGLIMQPIVGVVSDRCMSKYGRRRPFMIIGSIIVAGCLLVLGWTKEIVLTFLSEGEFAQTCMISLAVFAIYAVDFSINAGKSGTCKNHAFSNRTVMSCSRSLIVDTLPISKQQKGAAWSSRMVSLGHLAGYAVGTLDLVQLFGTSFGDTQFKKLTVFAGIGLILTVGITSWAVTERILVSRDDDSQDGLVKIIGRIYQATKQLPPRIQAICWIQFWSWIGWFPFLFYSTTWVGETYFRYDAPRDAKESNDALGDIGRIGSMALVVSSFITFISAFILPLIIKSPEEHSFTRRPPAAIAELITKFNKYQPDLLTAWICGHLMFSSAMILAPFAHSFKFATALVAFCGL